MSRRFADFRHPRPAPIGLGGWIALAVWVFIVLAVVWGLAALFTPRPARAWDGPQSDPAIGAWYRSLMQPDNPHISCCGEADAYWADQVVVEGDKVFAIVTDTRDDGPLGRPHIALGTRIEIPKWKYKFDRGNPTGHNILFVGASGVYCFVQGSGT